MRTKLTGIALVFAILMGVSIVWGATADLMGPQASSSGHGNLPHVSYSGGPDAYGYYFYDSADSAFNAPLYDWKEISAFGTNMNITGDDQNVGPFPIGFTFNFYGNNFTTFRACSNGFASFTSTAFDYTNASIPNPAEPNNLLAPYWDDLYPPGGGAAYYYTNNSDSLIIEWKDMAFFSGSGTVTFEIILTSDGKIVYQYGSLTGANDSHTIGIENQDGTVGLQYVYNTAMDESNTAIVFSTERPNYGLHKILVVAADDATLFLAELNAYPDVDTAIFFDAQTGTPTLSDLENYDAVAVWPNQQFADPAGLGNVLADYSDNGGGVVLFSFCFIGGWNLQGRIMTDYAPLAVGAGFAGRFMTTHDRGHYILAGSDTLYDYYAVSAAAAHTPVIVASYNDGTPAVAYNPVNNVVAVNCYPGVDRNFSGDVIDISHRALNFAIEGHADVLLLAGETDPKFAKKELGKYADTHHIHSYYGQYGTPSISYLSQYDAVVVWSNYSFNDPVLLGNRLADYVDVGGHVVMNQFCFGSGWDIQGRLMTSYSPFTAGTIEYATRTLGAHNQNNYLMVGVENVTDGFASNISTQNGGVTVAYWDDSKPFVAFNPSNGVVAINGYIGQAHLFTGDMMKLEHNAINFARGYTSISDKGPTLPDKSYLSQNYPNPFNPSTNIDFDLPNKADVTLEVFNVLGQRVATLASGTLPAGHHSVVFDASNIGSGIYFYKLSTDKTTETRKMVVLK